MSIEMKVNALSLQSKIILNLKIFILDRYDALYIKPNSGDIS